MTVSPNLVCIIVNYNSAALAVSAIESSLEDITANQGHIVLVDNLSPNNDAGQLKTKIAERSWTDLVSLVCSKDNRGYGAGNNIGFEYIKKMGWNPQYLYLLNPDTHLKPKAISALVDVLEKDAKVAAVGSRLEAENGSVHTSAFRFPTLWREFISASSFSLLFKMFPKAVIAPPPKTIRCETDWVAGASVLFRTSVFEDLGGFDETFFLYYEEVDLMLRLHRAGWTTVYCPDSQVTHMEGQSTGLSQGKTEHKKVPGYWFDSWRHYYRKNHGRRYAFLTAVSRLKGQCFCLVHRAIRGKGQLRQDWQNIADTWAQCFFAPNKNSR